MLTLERLNKKIEGLYDQLYDQDTTLMNRVNDLFEQMCGIDHKMSSLEATIKDQRDIIDAQDKRVAMLTPKDHNTKEYEIIWQSGHNQRVMACSVQDAHERVMENFTGSDVIVAIIDTYEHI